MNDSVTPEYQVLEKSSKGTRTSTGKFCSFEELIDKLNFCLSHSTVGSYLYIADTRTAAQHAPTDSQKEKEVGPYTWPIKTCLYEIV